MTESVMERLITPLMNYKSVSQKQEFTRKLKLGNQAQRWKVLASSVTFSGALVLAACAGSELGMRHRLQDAIQIQTSEN